ncbi:MAG: hypothetical protein Q4G27_00440 [Flavobacteriaceae bacterium]|nr:hypothetical protein [Flavobacteriaceae bacterium]
MKNNNDISSLIKKAQEKKIEPQRQEIRPIKNSILENEKIFSLYMPEEVLVELKILAAKHNTTIKSLINGAVREKYGL